jgi:hypothetical protein
MFMMPMPPTSSETAAMPASRPVKIAAGADHVEVVRLVGLELMPPAQDVDDLGARRLQQRRRFRADFEPRVAVGRAREIRREGRDRQQHEIVEVVPVDRAPDRRDQPDDAARQRAGDGDRRADRIPLAEERVRRRLAEDAHLRPLRHVDRVEHAAADEMLIVQRGVPGRDAVVVDAVRLAARHDIVVLPAQRHDLRDRRRLAEQRLHVAVGQRTMRLRIHAAAHPHAQDVRAERFEL